VIARESPGGPSCSRAPSSAPAPRQRMNGARLCAKSKDREKRNAPARYRSFVRIAPIAIPRFRHRRIKNARWRECRAKYVTGNVSAVVSPRHSRRRTRRGHEARLARRASRASRV
jgi:hypothetical protein